MTRLDYHRTIVDCPSLGLQRVSLRKVERILQHEWRTEAHIAFVLHRDSSGTLTAIESLPPAA